MRLLVMFIGLVSLTLGQPGAGADDVYRKTHEALMSTFLPVDELKGDARISQLFSAASDGIWKSAGQDARFRRLITPFTDLTTLGAACGMDKLVTEAHTAVYADMTHSQRERALRLLQDCDANEARRLASTVRNFYVVKAYGAIQEPLTGVKLNLYASSDWVTSHRPQLPPTGLRFDAARGEITAAAGPIDYLIVGSGPAGSVLAHELRRGGKRVVLVEKGSFIVPGSMETRLIDNLIDTRSTVDGAIRIRNGMAVGGRKPSQCRPMFCAYIAQHSVENRIVAPGRTHRPNRVYSRSTCSRL